MSGIGVFYNIGPLGPLSILGPGLHKTWITMITKENIIVSNFINLCIKQTNNKSNDWISEHQTHFVAYPTYFNLKANFARFVP